MRRTLSTSEACSSTGPRKWRLFLVDFLVRIWRFIACPLLIDPLLRTMKRFAALFLVFIFGMAAVLSLLYGVRAAVLAAALAGPDTTCCPPALTPGGVLQTYFFLRGASTITI
jgi:hypothetical protein